MQRLATLIVLYYWQERILDTIINADAKGNSFVQQLNVYRDTAGVAQGKLCFKLLFGVIFNLRKYMCKEARFSFLIYVAIAIYVCML